MITQYTNKKTSYIENDICNWPEINIPWSELEALFLQEKTDENKRTCKCGNVFWVTTDFLFLLSKKKKYDNVSCSSCHNTYCNFNEIDAWNVDYSKDIEVLDDNNDIIYIPENKNIQDIIPQDDKNDDTYQLLSKEEIREKRHKEKINKNLKKDIKNKQTRLW